MTTLKSLIKSIEPVYVNSDITAENFPIPKKIETENHQVFVTEGYMSSEEILEEIKKRGGRPANIYELMSLVEEGKLKENGWYLAFGSKSQVSHGHFRVPDFSRSDDGWYFCMT